MTDVEFWTEIDAPGPVTDLVTVCVVPGAVDVCVLVVVLGAADPDSVLVAVVLVAVVLPVGSDLAGAVTLFASAATLETA